MDTGAILIFWANGVVQCSDELNHKIALKSSKI